MHIDCINYCEVASSFHNCMAFKAMFASHIVNFAYI